MPEKFPVHNLWRCSQIINFLMEDLQEHLNWPRYDGVTPAHLLPVGIMQTACWARQNEDMSTPTFSGNRTKSKTIKNTHVYWWGIFHQHNLPILCKEVFIAIKSLGQRCWRNFTNMDIIVVIYNNLAFRKCIAAMSFRCTCMCIMH